MQKTNSKLIAFLAATTLMLSGCTSMKDENTFTGEKEFNESTKGAAIGATGGAAIGALAGGVGAFVGAAVGGTVGGIYGYNQDEAVDALKDDLEDMGVSISDDDGVIIVELKNNILFEKGSYEISKDGQDILDSFLNIITQMDKTNYLKVSGHTDNTGTKAFNIELSDSRAKTIAFYLYDNGFPANQIDYMGYGDLVPVASNKTEEGKSKNRRVVIEVIPVAVKY